MTRIHTYPYGGLLQKYHRNTFSSHLHISICDVRTRSSRVSEVLSPFSKWRLVEQDLTRILTLCFTANSQWKLLQITLVLCGNFRVICIYVLKKTHWDAASVDCPAWLCAFHKEPLCCWIRPLEMLVFSCFWLSSVTCWTSLTVILIQPFYCFYFIILFCKASWSAMGFEIYHINNPDIDVDI